MAAVLMHFLQQTAIFNVTSVFISMSVVSKPVRKGPVWVQVVIITVPSISHNVKVLKVFVTHMPTLFLLG